MQLQHYLLALAVAWALTLAFLPILFIKARHRAAQRGHAEGLQQRDAMAWRRLQDLESKVENRAIEREQEQRRHLQKVAVMQAMIDELESRIRAYTGLAVTLQDHQLMMNAAETLRLAHRTFNAIKGTEKWRDRSAAESEGLRRLAELVDAEVRLKSPIRPSTVEGEA